jgi:hypothetical protein
MSILLYSRHTIYNCVLILTVAKLHHDEFDEKLGKITEGITDKSCGQEIQRFAFELAWAGARRHPSPLVI